jgi:hypothetical protein
MPAAPLRKSTPGTRSKPAAESRLSRARRPETLPVADWQAVLRRQFGREQPFALRNLVAEPVFSKFRVDNPDSGTHCLVTIRGLAPGRNQCTCWNYATNHLGTTKHIEFTLARLHARRGGTAALARGAAVAHSEIRLDYLGARQLRLHPGTACPPKLLQQARQSFDPAAGWALPWSRLDDVGTLARAALAAGHELRRVTMSGCRRQQWPSGGLFSGFTARFRHSDEAPHFDTEGVSSSRGKARQKTLGANGGVLEGRPVLQHVDGVELRLEHSGAR